VGTLAVVSSWRGSGDGVPACHDPARFWRLLCCGVTATGVFASNFVESADTGIGYTLGVTWYSTAYGLEFGILGYRWLRHDGLQLQVADRISPSVPMPLPGDPNVTSFHPFYPTHE